VVVGLGVVLTVLTEAVGHPLWADHLLWHIGSRLKPWPWP